MQSSSIQNSQAQAYYQIDPHGNVRVWVGSEKAHGRVFAAHLDTVHREDGEQDIFFLDDDHLVADGPDGKASVLGADDAAGVYLLSEMIIAGVPGQYLFFVGEECGGIGSSSFVTDNPEFSADFVVSFDRKGTTDVITHQSCYQTASNKFANALAGRLNAAIPGFRYKACDGGVYTDSKEFADRVPECTNISVGYYREHTVNESQDLTHLLKLRDAVVALAWEKLPIDRVPEPDIPWGTYTHSSFYSDEWRGDMVVLNNDEVQRIRFSTVYIRQQLDKQELDREDLDAFLRTLEKLI